MKIRTVVFLMAGLIAVQNSALAQGSDTFHVFPQFADGIFPDGSQYKSTLMIQASFLSSSATITCNLRTYGMSTNFGSGAGTSFTFTLPSGGWYQTRTLGTQAFQGGYATLTCSTYVDAQVLYSYYLGGNKISEATVFSSDPSFLFRMIADQTEGARLGIAIANNTDISHTYRIEVLTTTGATFASQTVTIPARTALAKFLDEIIASTRNGLYQVKIQAPDYSDFSVIGLRFSGAGFTTIPAN